MKSVRSVERALDILRSFTAQPTQLASDIQKGTGLNRPTLYRLLHTLESKGYLRSSGDPRCFEVSEVALQLAGAWLARLDVARVSGPYLQRLWDASGETVALIVPHGETQRVIVQELRSGKPLSLSLGVGYIAPLHRGTSGRAILAFLDEASLSAVLRAVPARADQQALLTALARIRKHKVCVSRGEVIAGGASISSPVFGRDGGIVGAVTVFGPDVRLKGANQTRCSGLVVETATALSRALGYAAGDGAPDSAVAIGSGASGAVRRRG